MRKEVRLGLAVGAVLVAVLATYMVVVNYRGNPGGHSDVRLVAGDGSATEAPPPIVPDEKTAVPVPSNDVFAARSAPTDRTASPADETVSASDKGVNWAALLDSGSLTPLLTTTPTPMNHPTPAASPAVPRSPIESPKADLSGIALAAAAPRQTTPAPLVTPLVPISPAAPVITPGSVTHAVQVTAAEPRTHIVQKGETLSSIAQTAYGSANYYPHILRANPRITPERMRPGLVIVLPDAASVVPHAAAHVSESTATSVKTPAVDPSVQYQVREGDSLYKIAARLYGQGEKWESLYELNKAAIGPDSHKLKLGMVLRLPQPPQPPTARPAGN